MAHSSLQAGSTEFRLRFLIFAAIFVLGFQAYNFDHTRVALAIAQWIAHRRFTASLPSDRPLLQAVYGLAALLVILAAALRTWAAAWLRADVVHAPILHTDVMVADGPYRHTRNPLYLGAMLLAAGVGLDASRVGLAFILAATSLFVSRLILREESDLRAAQPEGYIRYLHAVPRLWPSLWPRLPPGAGHPAWPQAWAGELFFWLFAVTQSAYAATLNGRVLMIGTTLAVIAGAVTGAIAARRRRRSMPAL